MSKLIVFSYSISKGLLALLYLKRCPSRLLISYDPFMSKLIVLSLLPLLYISAESFRKTVEMERVQTELEENLAMSKVYQEEKKQKEEALRSLGEGLLSLYLCISPMGIPDPEPLVLVQKIERNIKEIFKKIEYGTISGIENKVRN